MARTNKKPTGRPKGSTNVISKEVKEQMATILKMGMESTIIEDLGMMSPKDRVNAYLTLAKFIVPTQKETSIDVTANQINPQFISEAMIQDLLELEAKTEEEDE